MVLMFSLFDLKLKALTPGFCRLDWGELKKSSSESGLKGVLDDRLCPKKPQNP